jgi:hypothetical protein
MRQNEPLDSSKIRRPTPRSRRSSIVTVHMATGQVVEGLGPLLAVFARYSAF